MRKLGRKRDGTSNANRKSTGGPRRAARFHPLLQLQRLIGNRGVQHLLGGRSGSALRLTEPGDPRELEAQRIADALVADGPGPKTGAHAPGEKAEARGSEPFSSSARSRFEPGFGRDLSRVRIHTGDKASAASQAVNAEAFTIGEDVFFGENRYPTKDAEGERLLAHELAHVGQVEPGVIARAVSPDYPKIKDNLSYGLFDWAITDAEAHEVLVMLAALNPADFADTLAQMESDGLLSRLLENVSDADRTAFAALIQSIHQRRTTAATAGHIESLMSYGLLDWAITDEEARLALEALKSLESTPARLRDVVSAIPAKQYERFFDNLSEKDRSENLRFLQDIELMRRTGMTLDEMSAAQKTHLEAEAAAAGVSVGTHIGGEVAARGYGGAAAVWWPSLLPAQKAAWIARFNTVLTRLRTTAADEVKRVILAAEAAGGGIFFLPEEVEELGPTTLAFRQGNKLGVGKVWLETAENNLEDVYENIVHELGGHLEYGVPASWDIMRGTLGLLPPGERVLAEAGAHSPYSAYGYMETEIYAELRELPHRTPGSAGDEPEADVEFQLEKIKQAFAPAIAEAIVRSIRRRIQLDSKITDRARELYDRLVLKVFGIAF